MQIDDSKKQLFVQWSDLELIMESICKNLDFPVNKILGVSRGGLVPGVMLSHFLNVPFEPFIWQTRDGSQRDLGTLLRNDEPDTLIFDDILDTGKTITEMKSQTKLAKYGTIFNKRSDIALDIEGMTLYNNANWIVFPWENLDNGK